MKKLQLIALLVSSVMLLLTLGLTIDVKAQATDPADTACEGIAATGADCSGGEDGLTGLIQNVMNILLFVIGAASVVMLVIGALRYTLSAGDAQAAAAAKNTIIYAIIGIIVAVMAWVIADFVFEQVGGGTSGGGGEDNLPGGT